MSADHSGPGWWQPPKRRRPIDCLPTVLLGAVLLVGSAGLLVACSGTSSEAVPGSPVVPGEDVVIVDMPAGYADVATACHRGTRIYVTAPGSASQSAIDVVRDRTCPGVTP